jgi:hypothetical protein
MRISPEAHWIGPDLIDKDVFETYHSKIKKEKNREKAWSPLEKPEALLCVS